MTTRAPQHTAQRVRVPAVTIIQIAALIVWAIGQTTIFAVADAFKSKAVLGGGLTVLCVALIVGDAIIRNGRSRSLINVVPDTRDSII